MLLGALVPAVISFFQNRQFKREYTELKKQTTTEISNLAEETQKKLDETLKEALEEESKKIKIEITAFKKNLERQIAVAKGSSFHLQTNQYKSLYPDLALSSASDALKNYLDGEDERNSRAVLSIIETDILNNLDKATIEESPVDIEESVNNILKVLKDKNLNGRYAINMDVIKREFNNAKKREPKTKTD